MVGVVVQAERVDEERAQPGTSSADDVDAGHVADVPDPTVLHRGAVDAHRIERDAEDARVGLHHAHVTGVDHALHLHAQAGPHLEDLQLAHALGHETVGVRHHPEAHSRVGERAQPVERAGCDASPQLGVGELAVEVAVQFPRLVRGRVGGDPEELHVPVEVLVPTRVPVGLGVEQCREARRAGVVRVVEAGRVHRDLGTCEGAEDARVVGEQEHPSGVEQHRNGRCLIGHDRHAIGPPDLPLAGSTAPVYGRRTPDRRRRSCASS